MQKIALSNDFKQYKNNEKFINGCLIVGAVAITATGVAALPLVITGSAAIAQAVGVKVTIVYIVSIATLIISAITATLNTGLGSKNILKRRKISKI